MWPTTCVSQDQDSLKPGGDRKQMVTCAKQRQMCELLRDIREGSVDEHFHADVFCNGASSGSEENCSPCEDAAGV